MKRNVLPTWWSDGQLLTNGGWRFEKFQRKDSKSARWIVDRTFRFLYGERTGSVCPEIHSISNFSLRAVIIKYYPKEFIQLSIFAIELGLQKISCKSSRHVNFRSLRQLRYSSWVELFKPMSKRPSFVIKDAQLAEFFQATYGTESFRQKTFLVSSSWTQPTLPLLERSIF